MTIDTIPANDRRETFTATGGQTVFPYDFPVFAAADLEVRRVRAGVETVLALTTDYTVTGAGDQAGGNVVLVAGATAGDTIVIRSNQPAARTTKFNDSGDLPASAINAEFNRLWIELQQLRLMMTQIVRVDPGDPTSLAPIGRAAERANKFIGFDATGLNVVFGSLTVGSTTVTPTAAGLLDDGSAAEMRATMGAAASGDIATSGLTMAPTGLAGRFTAGTGALERVTIGAGLAVVAGALAAVLGQAIVNPGYVRLANGLVIQWGNVAATTGVLSGGVAEGSQAITFPITFPAGIFGVVVAARDVSGGSLQEVGCYTSLATTGFTAILSCKQASTAMDGFYIAIGN